LKSVSALAGALLVLWTLREVFRDLFHPSASGSLSVFVARTLFMLMRRWKRLLPASGPVSLVCVIAIWVLLIAFGFSLIYSAFPSAQFAIQNPQAKFGFWPMIYFSLEVLTTLGLGDYMPTSTSVRVLVVLEALIGFSILTASVSSIVLLYPALGRMRSFARRLSVLRRVEASTGIRVEDGMDGEALQELAWQAIRVRIDLGHFPLSYYFATRDRDSALSANLQYLNEVAHRYQAGANSATRLTSSILCVAVSDLSELLRSRFIKNCGSKDAFRCYAEDHRTAEDDA
jgi:hypothetical protein